MLDGAGSVTPTAVGQLVCNSFPAMATLCPLGSILFIWSGQALWKPASAAGHSVPRLSSVWEVGVLSEMVCGLRFIVSLMGHWQLGVSQGMQHVARSLSSKTKA